MEAIEVEQEESVPRRQLHGDTIADAFRPEVWMQNGLPLPPSLPALRAAEAEAEAGAVDTPERETKKKKKKKEQQKTTGVKNDKERYTVYPAVVQWRLEKVDDKADEEEKTVAAETFAFLSPVPFPADMSPLGHLYRPDCAEKQYSVHFLSTAEEGVERLSLKRAQYMQMLKYTKRIQKYISSSSRAHTTKAWHLLPSTPERDAEEKMYQRRADWLFYGLLPYRYCDTKQRYRVHWRSVRDMVKPKLEWPSVATAISRERDDFADFVALDLTSKITSFPTYWDNDRDANALIVEPTTTPVATKRGPSSPTNEETVSPLTYRDRIATSHPDLLPLLAHSTLPLVAGQLYGVVDPLLAPTPPLTAAALRSVPHVTKYLPDLLRLLPIDRQMMHSFQTMPCLFHHLNRQVLLAELRQTVLRAIPVPLPLLDQALTPPNRLPHGVDYEQLELLGDALLKCSLTTQLFASRRYTNEGAMCEVRRVLLANATASAASNEMGLLRYCFVSGFRPRHYFAPFQKVNSKTYDKGRAAWDRLNIPDTSKQHADIVESIAGAIAIHEASSSTGLSLTGPAVSFIYRVLRINVSVRETLELYENHLKQERIVLGPSIAQSFLHSAMALGVTWRYAFRYPTLLIQALTHGSCENVSTPKSTYDMLECLGDALLDYMVAEYICLLPQTKTWKISLLSDTKQSIVSGFTLGMLATQMGLHQHLLHHQPTLAFTIEKFVARYGGLEAIQKLSPAALFQYHNAGDEHSGIRYQPPKVLSDLFESIVGAIFVDTGFDYAKTKSVVLPVMQAILQSGVQQVGSFKSPVRRWEEYVSCHGFDKSLVDYKYKRIAADSFRCDIMYDKVHVSTGFSDTKVVAKTSAAAVALHNVETRIVSLPIPSHKLSALSLPESPAIEQMQVTEENNEAQRSEVMLSEERPTKRKRAVSPSATSGRQVAAIAAAEGTIARVRHKPQKKVLKKTG